MGYKVFYQMRMGYPDGSEVEEDTHNRVVDYINADSDLLEELGEDGSGDLTEPSNYPGPEGDMVGLSLTFPDILFLLYEEGEESPDFGVSYYLGGEGYEVAATLIYPPFEGVNLWGREDGPLHCPECGEGERFTRYSNPVVHKERIDKNGRASLDLGYVCDGEPDEEIRCAACDAVVAGD